jgi:DNA repair protein RadD
LLAKGFLAKLNYYDLTCINLNNVRSNSTGSDYDDASLLNEYKRSNYMDRLVCTVQRLLKPKSGVPRKGILVFTRRVEEARMLTEKIDNSVVVSAETPKKEREDILERFKKGEIKVVVNAQTLTTGFDYPELDTVVMARPTKSLSLWYQCVGRAIRPYQNKEGWIIDLCGNIKRFGRVEELRICDEGNGKWCVKSNGKQLTNVYL